MQDIKLIRISLQFYEEGKVQYRKLYLYINQENFSNFISLF